MGTDRNWWCEKSKAERERMIEKKKNYLDCYVKKTKLKRGGSLRPKLIKGTQIDTARELHLPLPVKRQFCLQWGGEIKREPVGGIETPPE